MSGPSGTSPGRPRVPARRASIVAWCALVASGCATTVVHVDRQIGDGSVRIDPERPILLEEAGDSIDLSVPLLYRDDAEGFLGPCSMRAVELDTAGVQAMRDAPEGLPIGVLGDGTLLATTDSVTPIQARGVHMTRATKRLRRGTWREVDALTGGVYLELQAQPTPAAATNCQALLAQAPGQQPFRSYLLRFGEVRGAEGSAVALVALVFAAVVLSYVR